MNNNQKLINEKLKEFAQKYYLNRLYRGGIFFVAIALLTFITYAVLEYFSYFGTTVRTILFYSYLLLFGLTFLFYILIPLFKILGLGKQISKQQIAQMVGKHFPEIDDKLLNILELEEMEEMGDYQSRDLILAAIDTKIESIKPYPFAKAIPFKKTTKHLKWAILPILLFIVIFSVKSEIFTDSTERIVHHEQVFEKPAPYEFEITNSKLTAFQNDDFSLGIKVLGDETPDEVYVSYNKRNYKMVKVNNTEFTYTFTNLQNDIEFQLITDEVSTQPFTLQVLPKPITISFVMQLQYPSYLNKNNETIENNGTATVPEGTKITWAFYTKNTDTLHFILPEKMLMVTPENGICRTSVIAKAAFDYSIVNTNKLYTSKDTLRHSISIITDQYPEIYVESRRDSLFADRIYFKGNIKDDYGFSSLRFVYTRMNAAGEKLSANQSINIDINRQNTIQDFYYYFDAGTLGLNPGDKLDYHFEVRDNDGVNGAKMTRSNDFEFAVKTMEEVEKEINSNSNEAKNEMQDLMKESDKLLKELDDLNKQLIQSKNPNWQDKKKLEKLMQEYNELQKELNELKQQQKEQRALEDQFKDFTPEILKKQEELDKRFDEILNDEMKKMMEKMQNMMDQMDKNKMEEAMKQMKLSTEEINKNLDEQLQLFKQLEFDKKFNDILEKTKSLGEEEKKLAEDIKNNLLSKEELQKKQAENSKKYEDLKKEMQDLKKLNSELEEPNTLPNKEELQKQIEQNMQEGKDALQKNNKNKAAEKHKEAGEQMEQMANEMQIQMLDEENEELEEDYAVLRQILDNLVRISFKQESNMLSVSKMTNRSSLIGDALREMISIQDNMTLIEDSLNALARRQSAVKPFIKKEVSKINEYLTSAKNNLNERRVSSTTNDQQFALTSMNNLALMLAESMKEVKEKQQENRGQCSKCKKNGKSSSSCSNPGNQKKSTAKTAKELQQQLNRQMEALKKQMEQQGKQQGKTGQGGEQQSMSEQFARMAAQQEAIRKMMQDYDNALKSQNGVGDKSIEQMIKDMEKTETELVNKIISQQTLNRQKQIETRLLESERAEMKRDKDKERESTEAKDIRNPNPPKEWNMDKQKQQQTEMLKSVPPSLNYYYKEKVNQYFYNIE
ncbi:MAG: hypothetical protein MJZ76_03115 [Bacteroidales bacterium]|nr:hypothetical protein [Bacteroidales bacterium]